jgi:hypothetical protein
LYCIKTKDPVVSHLYATLQPVETLPGISLDEPVGLTRHWLATWRRRKHKYRIMRITNYHQKEMFNGLKIRKQGE